jgi:hypothetical protein
MATVLIHGRYLPPRPLRRLVSGKERLNLQLLKGHVLRCSERLDRAEEANLEIVLLEVNRKEQIRRAEARRRALIQQRPGKAS